MLKHKKFLKWFLIIFILIVAFFLYGIIYYFIRYSSIQSRSFPPVSEDTLSTYFQDDVFDSQLLKTKSYVFSQQPDLSTTILAFGDMMLDRYVKRAIDKHSPRYPFEAIEPLLQENDITLVNLEGPVTDFRPRPLNPNNTTFTFSPALLPTLKEVGINLVTLANNHTRDFGEKGFDQTRSYLTSAGIDFYGDNKNSEGISYIKDIRGIKIGFIGYNQYRGSNFEGVLSEIRILRPEVSFLIVSSHWGIEYKKLFAASQQKEAHQIIDAGADVILGHHPHVIQPIEIYNNKVIFYSLGNFLFDQTFSVATQQGLGVNIVLKDDRVTYLLFPTEIIHFQIKLASEERRKAILETIARDSVVSLDIKQKIREGAFSL